MLQLFRFQSSKLISKRVNKVTAFGVRYDLSRFIHNDKFVESSASSNEVRKKSITLGEIDKSELFNNLTCNITNKEIQVFRMRKHYR